jgi:hypothetical protein
VREQPLRLVRAQREKKFFFVAFFFTALQTTFATSATTTTRKRRRLCLLEQNLQRTEQEGENDEESRRGDAHLRRALVRARFKAARGVLWRVLWKIFMANAREYFLFGSRCVLSTNAHAISISLDVNTRIIIATMTIFSLYLHIYLRI